MRKTIYLSLIFTFLMATSVWAAWTNCVSSISGRVVTNDGCQWNPSFTNDSGGQVNLDGGMFAHTDWLFAGKEEFSDGSIAFESGAITIGFDITGSANGGNWSVNPGAWGNYEDIALVFKDGNGTYLTAYSLVSGASAGTWSTPFTNPPFNLLPGNSTSHGVSHISAYARGTSVVPEPGTIILLGSGLVGLAGWGRKKLRK